jgi:hypothetical protein
MSSSSGTALWLCWVGANGLGEMFGLALTFAVGALVFSGLGDQGSLVTILASFLVAVASSIILAF